MIKVLNVSKIIKKNIILDNISVSLEKGNIYGFVGRNGSGKSMLFKVISGLIVPTSGNVIINNIDIYKSGTFPYSTRVLLEKPNFIEEDTGIENLKMLANIQNKISINEIEDVLKILNLFEYKDKLVKEYSLGMLQKLGIAQVLMEDPEIMIFDEPFNSLDKESVELFREILINLKNKGKLILISSHINEDINILCDKIFNMDNGNLING